MTKQKRRRHVAGAPPRHDPWQSARTFADLIRANCAFLRGENIAPYYTELFDPSVANVDNLLTLNSYGLLTYGGQLIERSTGKCIGIDGKERDEFFEAEQKPYCDFFVQKHVASEGMVDALVSKNDHVSTFVIDIATGKRRTNVTSDLPDAHNGANGLSYCVTKERVAKKKADLAAVKWSPFTSISFSEIEHVFVQREPNIVRALRDTYSVSVSGRSSAGGDVEQMLIKMCEELKFPRFET